MSLRSDDQMTVDNAAAAVPSVIEALLAEIPEARRLELEAAAPGADLDWFAREGDEGAFVLAGWCRRELLTLPRYMGYTWPRIVERVRMVVNRLEGKPVGSWIWVELLGTLSSHKRTVAEYVVSIGASVHPDYTAPARAAIRAKIPARSLLFDRLLASHQVSIDDALEWLPDPPLRPMCEAILRDHVAAVEPRLRAMLDDATPGTRESIVRLLRTIDERVDAAGESSTTSLADLETRLRADPTDVTTAQVWADLMQDAGDPRGALLALDLAIAQEADRERMLELSVSRAELFARDRKHLLGKPGGWPFREKYLGRGYVAFGSTWRGMIRGKPTTREERVMEFFGQVTNVTEPLADGHVLHATFKLTWPGTRIALPYQEDGHYPTAFGSSLRANLASGKLELHLAFPFEDYADPRFVEIYGAVADTLGKYVLTPTGFSICTPTVDGKKMKSKSLRYR